MQILVAMFAMADGGTVIPPGIPMVAPNCSLLAPPSNSGDALGDEPEFDLKVFPRLGDFPRNYTGCQVIWRQVGTKWALFAVAYFEKGKPVVFFGPGAADSGGDLNCRYRGRRLASGSDDECPDAEGVALHSMPAGCAKQWRSRAAAPECKFD